MSAVVPLNWYGVLLAVAALSAWVLTFPVRRIAVQIGYVAQPDERKIHQKVTPGGRRGGHVRGHAGGLGRGRLHPGPRPAVPRARRNRWA